MISIPPWSFVRVNDRRLGSPRSHRFRPDFAESGQPRRGET
ncbi:MAG TPA: hypothetical protein VLA12_00225 [Planctomycetaceae bacterium]|nr:hypothetical protein [Planctomycetaceae bacterium]